MPTETTAHLWVAFLTTAQVESQFSDMPRSCHILMLDSIVGRYSSVQLV